MLSPSFLYIPQFQPPCLFLPQPSQSSKGSKQVGINQKKYKNLTKYLCFSCKDRLFSNRLQKTCHVSHSAQNPDADLSDSVSRDLGVLASLIQSSCTVKEIRRLHAIVVKFLGAPVTFVDNNLISSYARVGKLLEARKVFDRMMERNVVSWTAILNGYLRAGFDEEASRLFSELVESGVQANSKTFVCILNLCSRRSNFELGRQIHACILKGNWSNLIVDSAVVHFYAQCCDLSSAFQAFDRMLEHDVVCWTTIITACAQHGHEEEAFHLFAKMQSEGFIPNEYTVCSVLKACSEVEDLSFGRQLHGALVKSMFKDDVFVGTSLVGMYAKCGEVLASKKVFDRMRKRNTVTWTSMIAGYAQNGLGEEAISLFRVMKRRNIYANKLTIVGILRACGSIGALTTGKEVHTQVLKNSIQNNIYVGSTLVWFYCKCAEFIYASKVLQSMPFRGVVSWTAIISGYAHLGYGLEALEFLKEMLCEGVVPNPFTYSSALKACANVKALLQGKWIHSSVNKTCSLSNVFVGSALIDMYAKCGCVSEAIKVFDSMPERNSVSWKAMIVGYARNGLCREALKLMYRMQAEGIKVDDYILTTVLSACGDVELELESSSERCLQPN
ncbi:PREDICTED: pentatricopeptide repeat-containing protein At4g18520-like [Nelumbo nucifera]|uniref:Pentatricopeptide repeat-containing protein At4g18520-like n=1 Tax=Nelumbo nucifera TaxID=4432 RepID=A0A1U8AFL1_NELNU|nr:PREDICTED: pentatricopeptide repeat-containing protein At4g18520-like [Nelumbo nucifera]